MALPTVTPRDRLQRLLDLGRKTLRNWWLIALFAVVGGGLSLAFAMLKARSYTSTSTLFYLYQEDRYDDHTKAAERKQLTITPAQQGSGATVGLSFVW